MKKADAMLSMIKKILEIFSYKQKIGLVFVIIMILLSAICELLCLPVVTPIINIATDIESIHENRILNLADKVFQFENVTQYVIFAIVLIILVYLLKNVVTLILYKVQYGYIYNGQKELSDRILRKYIYKDYNFHKSHNVAELQRDVSTDITSFYTAVLTLVQLFTEIVICVTLTIYLLLQDAEVTLCTILILSILLFGVLFFYRSRLKIIGERTRHYSATRNKWILQSFGAIKEVKVFSKEEYFVKKYYIENEGYHDSLKQQQLLVNIPKPIMETCAVCAIMVALIFKLSMDNDIATIMEILAIFVVAAFRLLPSFSRISSGLTTMSYYSAAIDAVHLNVSGNEEVKDRAVGETKKIDRKADIKIENISFKYPDDEVHVLRNVNFMISPNESIALIGSSGSGKTTLADLLLGINEPSEGTIRIGEANIFDDLYSWHSIIGYIPQTIYLLDDTIRANIAFGIAEDKIDDEMLWVAIKQAQLESFILSLDEGIDTLVGEAGVRLSGGQRQRIGIARALYNNPSILVLDEATSSLDNETEQAVMDAIEELQGSKTLVIIAHRLSTVKNCDKIYEVKEQNVSLITGEQRKNLFSI